MTKHAVYKAGQVREMDRRLIDGGVPGYTLMQRAAAAGLRLAQRRWPAHARLLILAGPGNNGGDGVELARQARAAGINAHLLWLDLGGTPGGEAGQARAAWDEAHGAPPNWSPERFDALARPGTVLIDALFGTGLSRDVEDDAARCVEHINAAGRRGLPVLALDCPSGTDADTGAQMGVAVRADVTTSFIARTIGLFLDRGRVLAGEVVLDTLDAPDAVLGNFAPAARVLRAADLRLLPRRQPEHHKGRFGDIAIVGGDAGMPGAPVLAARAALRSGAGLVRVMTHPEHAPVLPAAQPELMCVGLPEAAALARAIRGCDVLAIGPGLGQTDWGRSLWMAAMSMAQQARPGRAVVDADALNWLAKAPQRLGPGAVITPHPGEAARLLGTETASVQRDRPDALAQLVERYGCCVVLKGAGTLVAGPDDAVPWLCAAGNPGMATGGSGDALTGVIAALLALDLSVIDAARLGVLAHALAGDAAARKIGQTAMLPSDLISCLADIWPS